MFSPGDKVVCIRSLDRRAGWRERGHNIAKGQIYCVEKVEPATDPRLAELQLVGYPKMKRTPIPAKIFKLACDGGRPIPSTVEIPLELPAAVADLMDLTGYDARFEKLFLTQLGDKLEIVCRRWSVKVGNLRMRMSIRDGAAEMRARMEAAATTRQVQVSLSILANEDLQRITTALGIKAEDWLLGAVANYARMIEADDEHQARRDARRPPVPVRSPVKAEPRIPPPPADPARHGPPTIVFKSLQREKIDPIVIPQEVVCVPVPQEWVGRIKKCYGSPGCWIANWVTEGKEYLLGGDMRKDFEATWNNLLVPFRKDIPAGGEMVPMEIVFRTRELACLAKAAALVGSSEHEIALLVIARIIHLEA